MCACESVRESMCNEQQCMCLRACERVCMGNASASGMVIAEILFVDGAEA
jgi:hypothetical protein